MSITIRKVINGYVVSDFSHQRIPSGAGLGRFAANQLGTYGDGQERIYATFDDAVEFMRKSFEPVNPYAGSTLVGSEAKVMNVEQPHEQPEGTPASMPVEPMAEPVINRGVNTWLSNGTAD